jgi:hypothetical protein
MESQPSTEWTRNTPWRQGHILMSTTVEQLRLVHPESRGSTCVVVISHDCDLANDDLTVEPMAEVIIGRILPKGNGSCRYGKSPRVLHLEAMHLGNPVIIEIAAPDKRTLDKRLLSKSSHDPAFTVSAKELATLRYWLGIRYKRAAFSNEFEARMASTKMKPKLAKLLEDDSLISGVYFDVDAGEEVDHNDGSPHSLTIVLAYDAGDDPIQSMDTAENLAARVEKAFAAACFDEKTEVWTDIYLRGCIATSEDDLTVSRAKALKLWRLEHLSHRDDDPNPTPFELTG